MTTGGDDDDVAVRERFTAAPLDVVGPALMEDEEDAAEDSTAVAVAVELRSAAERESAGFCTAMI